jgi:hypothetical protein
MKTKIEITRKQAQQFNAMLAALRRIRKYDTPERMRRDSEKTYGTNFEEALEMAYENIQAEARAANNVKPIEIPVQKFPPENPPIYTMKPTS